jgi:transcriptional regulator with GAF, ATPase, and Fis domain
MTTFQGQHFIDFDAAPARRTDPPTSVAAGQAMTAAAVDEHERLILAALAAGPAGKTELAARIGSMTDQQVIRRMKRLERLGRVERTGLEVMSAARRGETEWRVVGGGRV